MPTSWPSQISPIMNILLAASPKSILDIGCGYGKFGVLCREYLDVVRGASPGATYPPPRKITIDCIEAFPEYISPIHKYVYDNIHIGDAMEILPALSAGSYEVALAIDMLEHFPREEAAHFIEQVMRAARVVLIATPTTEMPQSASFGNAYERHRSHWNRKELRKMAPTCRFVSSLGVSTGHIALLSSDAQELERICKRAWTLRWVSFRTALLEHLRLRRPVRRLLRRQSILTVNRPGADAT